MKYIYDDANQLRTAFDLKGNSTTYAYDTATDTFPTQITSPTVGGVTQTVRYSYDIASGALMSSTDQNNNTTFYTYDTLLRPLTITSPDGGVVTNTYSIGGTGSTTTTSIFHNVGTTLTSTAYLDPVGRTSSTISSTGARVDYTYDGNGNVVSVSQPYFGTPTGLTTTYTYDALGRQRVITESDGSKIKSDPSGNTVTVTDEAGHQRKFVYDGAGRISQVLEPDSGGNLTVETDYAYGQNATTSAPFTYQTIITQKGGSTNPSDWRVRTFTYDRGMRLLSQQTPEAGTTSYTYSSNTSGCSGSLTLPCSKTDANRTGTQYNYDALNRLTGKTYVGYITPHANTSSVSYLYDQSSYNGLFISNGKGRRTGMTNGSGTTAWSFDYAGRPYATIQTIAGVTKQASYSYNQDGSLNALTDFSGTILNYNYDSNARLTGISTATPQGIVNYASAANYNAAGQLLSLTHQQHPPYPGGGGNPTYVRSFSYNSRLQPQLIQAVDGNANTIQSLTYAYGTAGLNNGNISTIRNDMDSTGGRDQTFQYDNLNRLALAYDGINWGEAYTYDNWGNMYKRLESNSYGGGDNWTVPPPGSNNQIAGMVYDNAGQVTTSTATGISFTYDAEGRILTAGNGSYTYDGDGNRVSKTVSGTTTLYWPTLAGISDESDSTGTHFGKQIYFAGMHIYSEDITGSGLYLFQDHLGSTRITGDTFNNLQDDIDYLPFGEIMANFTSGSNNHYLFTGYEADYESQTNYATFRNLDGLFARFNRPDPYDGSYDWTNPQSFNRYAYVLNNPMKYTDPSGLTCFAPDDEDDNASPWHVEASSTDGPSCNQAGGVWVEVDESVTVTADPNDSTVDFSGFAVNQTQIYFQNFIGFSAAPNNSVGSCLSQALSDGRGAALFLDAVGDVALAVAISNPASLTALAVGQAASVLGTLNSIQHSDLVGSGIGFSNQVAGATGIVTHGLEIGGFIKTGTSFAKGLTRAGIFGAVVSTVTDGAQAISAYANCRSTP